MSREPILPGIDAQRGDASPGSPRTSAALGMSSTPSIRFLAEAAERVEVVAVDQNGHVRLHAGHEFVHGISIGWLKPKFAPVSAACGAACDIRSTSSSRVTLAGQSRAA